MANYRFFSVLHPEEVTDPLFPVLNSNFVPVFTEDDGNEIESLPVQGMFVLKDSSENTVKIVSGSKDLKGTLWITSQRVVVVCRNFDQVKWDRTNSVNTAFFGIGTEVAWHLGEKAVHKIKSAGKAMASHVYFPWIESIGYRPGRERRIQQISGLVPIWRWRAGNCPFTWSCNLILSWTPPSLYATSGKEPRSGMSTDL